MSHPKTAAMQPMIDMFGSILTRLDVIESKLGIGLGGTVAKGRSPASTPVSKTRESIVVDKMGKSGTGGEAECVKAFDVYFKTCVVPFSMSCDEFDEKLKDMGQEILNAWEGMRGIIVLATRAKLPEEELTVALTPFLEKTQTAVKNISKLRLDRDHDRHYKAVVEMLACCSWVLHRAPKNLPSAIVKESLGAAEFWLNRIRKDHKNDEMQLGFCNNMKKVLTELAKYIEQYHKTGLTWNPRGVSLAEAAVVLGDDRSDESPSAELPKGSMRGAKSPRSPMNRRLSIKALGAVSSANVSGLMSELANRKSADGSSAATGLKHVTKDQQTWRKEFKEDEPVKKKALVIPKLEDQKKKTKETKKFSGLPIFEYQDRGFKWAIEHQNAQSVKSNFEGGIITVEISDPKQQVYLYDCNNVTVQVKSKFKSLIVDKCEKCAVVFESIISSVEVVNSKRVQLQTKGVCPVFTIDKTQGCLIWLSEESKQISSFVASQSSEMNVSFPDGDDQKEVPIPEQFVHKLVNGSVTSEVSDLYH